MSGVDWLLVTWYSVGTLAWVAEGVILRRCTVASPLRTRRDAAELELIHRAGAGRWERFTVYAGFLVAWPYFLVRTVMRYA